MGFRVVGFRILFLLVWRLRVKDKRFWGSGQPQHPKCDILGFKGLGFQALVLTSGYRM